MIEPLKVAAGLVLVAAAIYVLAPPLSTLTDRLPAPLHRAAITPEGDVYAGLTYPKEQQ